jgi:hypothetical protein
VPAFGCFLKSPENKIRRDIIAALEKTIDSGCRLLFKLEVGQELLKNA